MKRMKRILAILTVLAMVVTSVPSTFYAEAYAATDSTDTRIADDPTLEGWKQYFGGDENNFDTRYAGHVWTDKSVTTDASKFGYAKELADGSSKIALNDDQNNFLVSLSAMASSKSITGQDNKPTDTMIVLDMSSSMYKNSTERDPGPVTEMIKSVNSTIKQLQELNVNNRVGVTIYYGGPDLNQAPANSYQLWLPLDRYKHKDNKFLVAKTSSGKLSSAGVNSNVTTESGTAVKANTRATTSTAGTYMQQGILSALDEFMDADTKVPDNAAVNAGETRTPVMVLMSDGKPTAATNLYTQLDKAAIMGSNREDIRSANETDFLTQLTASYAKERMDAHYKEETPLLYTLSFGNGFSYTVMDPSGTLEKKNTEHESSPATVSGYWNKLIANNSITLSYKVSKGQWDASTTNKSCTVSRTTVDGKTFPSSASQQYYVDKAFEAADASDLEKAFANIFTDISLQTHTYPTLVDGDENLDGYVSFVDKIGEYMSVTDVKGILLGTTWYSGKEFAKNLSALGDISNPTPLGDELVWSIQQRLGLPDSVTVRTLLNLAYQYGQLAYDNDGSYSNYVGWYSDAQGNYLGFWQEGITTAPGNATHTNKSYIYLGETDDSHGVADSDMMYTTVRVRHEIKTGVESVSFAVPAALIPTVEYDVEYNENDTLKSVTKGGAQHPIRLVYEVALDDSIDEISLMDKVDADYIKANQNTDGSVNFYTNQYEADGSVGYGKVNTYSYFKPSHQNENYYYQENETVYTDQKGTAYKNGSAPDANGTYYREITVYSKSGSTIKAENIYRQLSKAALETAVPKADGTWYIPKGNVHVNMDGYTVAKDENKTATLANVNTPYVDVNGHHVNDTDHRFVIGDTLGNNGKVKLMPVTGIKIAKKVEGTTSATDESFEFIVTADAALNGEVDAVLVAADGTRNAGTVTFAEGKAKVSLKDGERIYITGLPADTEFKITETEEADFVLSKVEVDGVTAEGTAAEITTTLNNISEAEFTNIPRGEGALTIAKQVVHPLGTSYQIPADKTFKVNVKLEGVAVKSGDKFEVIHSGDADLKEVKVGNDNSFTLTLKDGEQVEIKGVPEGTKATVTEENPGTGFTVTYKENGADGDGVIESVKKAPTIDNVTVVNTYEPAPTEVKIDLSGVKTLIDENGELIAKEDWDDLEFQFIIQKYVYENGSWKWIDTESIDVANKTDDEVDFVSDGRVLTFNEVGTYGYQVIEKNHGLTIDGITYDAEMHTFDVIVTDKDMDGTLEAEVKSSHGEGTSFVLKDGTWTNDQINFVNSNNRKETSELIMIKKELENASGSSEVSLEGYQFELFESDAAYKTTGDKVLTTPATDAAGETYVSLTYDYKDEGTYYYILKEKATGIPAMTDSDKVYKFKVVVTANNDGTVTSEIVAEGDTAFEEFESGAQGVTYDLATFKNIYEPTDAEVSLDVKKTLANRTLKEGEFSFLLKQGSEEIQTVTNDADGNVVFDKLVFDTVGTYEYTVEETSASGDGVTVDETVYDVIITVTDNNGNLEAAVDVLTVPGTEMLFENDYQPQDVSVKLGGEKNLEGRDLTGGQFTFVLAESDYQGNIKEGGLQQRVTNNNNGGFEFDKMTYSAKGTHYYVVYEDVPQNTQGITYDSTKYLVTIDIGYDMDAGEFVVNKAMEKMGSGDEAFNIKFNNDYKAAATTAVITGIKDLQGRNLEESQFQFELYSADEDWTKGNKLQTKSNDDNGYFQFDLGKDVFKTAGTYRYIIDEIDSDAPGYTYDAKEVGAIITVTDDLAGKLHAEVAYVDLHRLDDGTVTETPVTVVEFDNDYTIEGEAKVNLEGTKSLTGRDMVDGEFTFILTDVTDSQNPVEAATATNDADGKFAFELTYTAADVGNTYTYMLTEKNGGQIADGVTYDDEEYKIVVEVSDDGKGGVATDVKIRNGLLNLFEADEIKFENKYKTTDTAIRFTADKQLTGRDLENGEFSFKLVEVDADGKEIAGTEQTVTNGSSAGAEGVYFNKITYTAPGTHTYKISEVAGDLGGVTYDKTVITVKVDVTDNGKGQLVAKINGKEVGQYNAGDFVNTYKTKDVTVAPEVTKNFTGRDWAEGDAFTFALAAAGDETIKAVTDGKVKFAGTKVTIDSDDKDKKAKFGNITFNEPGVYSFSISEESGTLDNVTYDEDVVYMTVTVTDNLKGELVADTSYSDTMTFDNNYIPDAVKVGIEGIKTLEGRDLNAGEFTFELVDDKGNVIDTVSNSSNGTFRFYLDYDKEGTYEYQIREKAGDLAGVTYDSTVYNVTVEVAYNSATGKFTADVEYKAGQNTVDTAEFVNDYTTKETDVQINLKKVVTEKDNNKLTLEDGQNFQFGITPAPSNPANDPIKHTIVSSTEVGDLILANAEYKAPGTYVYTVNEIDTEIPGVNYDDSLYTVTVVVTDDESTAKLSADVQIKKGDAVVDEITFNNTFDPEDTTATIHGHKVLKSDHKALEAGEFKFQLINKATGIVIEEVTNTATGVYQFKALHYATAGEYEYQIKEVVEEKGGYTYDDKVYDVKVTVTTVDGALLAHVENNMTSYGGDNLANLFTNTYEPAETTAQFKGAKTLEGRDLNAGEFSFVLKDANGKEVETVANDANGTFEFKPVEFTEAGEYKYTVSEVKGDLGGVTYDETVYDVTVTVTDKEGQLKAETEIAAAGKTAEEITFTNKYKASPVKVGFDGTKDLTGREMKAGEFKFVLKDANDKEVETVANDANNAFDFKPVEFTEAGEYKYTVSEVKGDLGGVTYDETVYDIVVKVKDDLEGKLVAETEITKDGAVVNTIEFKNGYNTKPADITLQIGKDFKVPTERGWLTDEVFNFTLVGIADTADNPAVTMEKTKVSIGGDDADKPADFGKITISETGMYRFEISEDKGDIAGVDYDDSVYKIRVDVIDDGNGNLVIDLVRINGVEVDTLKNGVLPVGDFVNEFTPDPVKVTVEGMKYLDGRDLNAGEFKFGIEAINNGDPLPEKVEVTNTADGKVSFGEIEYTEPGEYKYIIFEEDEDLGGVKYDTNDITATVKVEYVNGVLTAFAPTYDYGEEADADKFEFFNSYAPADTSVQLSAAKTLVGRDITNGEFTIQLKDGKGDVIDTADVDADGNFDFDPIKYDKAGTHEYTVSEIKGDIPGVDYDENIFTVKVVITDNGDGTLSSQVTKTVNGESIGVIQFYNTYTPDPATVDLGAVKQLDGRDWFESDKFVFELAAEGDTRQAVRDGRVTIPNSTVTVDKDNQNALFENIKFTKAGEYNFVITERAGDIAAVEYDKHSLHAIVTVTDDNKGNLIADVKYAGSKTFVNTYTTEDSEPVQFKAIKTVDAETGTDYELAAGDFEFQLEDEEGNVLQTKANDADGIALFDAITYDAVGTYTYTISEVEGSRGGITYDDTEYTVVVKVTDNGAGKLVTSTTVDGNDTDMVAVDFENRYDVSNASIQLSATKTLEGRDWFDTDKFTFTLTPAADTEQAVADGIVKLEKEKVTITKASTDKTASFGDIEFEKPGTYNFVIEEKAGNIDGVTYDTHKAEVAVTVTDNLDGSMSAVATPTVVGSLTFVNTYVPKDVPVSIEGTKVLTGRTLAADEFTFELAAITEGAPMPGTATVKNAADGSVDFGTIIFKEAGTYEYKITETEGSLAGITYDDSVIKAIVKVTYDKATGMLNAKVSYEGTSDENGFVFNNEYNTNPVSVELDADKKVIASEGNAYDMKAGDFKFELAAADSNPDSDPVKETVTVENDADGNVALGTLQFTEAGEYIYTVKEISSGIAGISYDDAVYTITVKVTDNEGKAQLEAVTSITKAGTAVDAMVFENGYDPAETSVNFDGMKVLESGHKALEADEFTFQLKDADGKVIDTATNSAAGTFQFGSITYDREGTFEYTVSEVNDGKAGYTYDDAVHKITVVVTDEDGALKAAVTGGTADDIVFTNSYEPAPADLVISGHKALTGRDLNDGEFEFAVMDGEKEIATAANKEDGSFTFGALNFTEAGTYNYTIVEKNTSVAGVTYDQVVYGVTIKVVDEGGALKVESADYLQNGESVDSITFGNTYKPAPTSIQLGAAKVLEGRDLKAGEFKFVLEDENGNKLYAENTADGKIVFDEINYDAAGTYTYKLYEESGDEKHMIYDETVYDITVTVKDDLAGNLKAEIEGLDDGAVFKNVYAPKAPHLNIEKLQSVNGGKATKDVLIVEEGDIITYNVRVWSDGECAAEDIIIKDVVPEGLELIEESLAAEGGVLGADGKTITWNIDKLEAGEDATVTFQVKAPLADKDQLEEDGYQHWYNIASVAYGNNPENPGEPDDPSDPTDPDEPYKEIPSNEVEVKQPLPEEPTAPMDETSDGGTQTGDDFNAGLYGFLALAALAVAGAAFRRRKAE